jgi:isoleucyl-tRNA synthetase
MFSFLPGAKAGESVHTADWPSVGDGWKDAAFEERYALFLELRPHVLKALEAMRAQGKIGASLEARVTLRTASARDKAYLGKLADELPMLLIVSQVVIEDVGEIKNAIGGTFARSEVLIERADGAKCPRCWNYKTDIGSDGDHPEVCSRCARAVKNLE